MQPSETPLQPHPLDLCNGCDANPADPADPAGYCDECNAGVEAQLDSRPPCANCKGPLGEDNVDDVCGGCASNQLEGPTCSICDALGHGYPGGGPCPLESPDPSYYADEMAAGR